MATVILLAVGLSASAGPGGSWLLIGTGLAVSAISLARLARAGHRP